MGARGKFEANFTEAAVYLDRAVDGLRQAGAEGARELVTSTGYGRRERELAYLAGRL